MIPLGFWSLIGHPGWQGQCWTMNEINFTKYLLTNRLPKSSEHGVWEVRPCRRCWSLWNGDWDFILSKCIRCTAEHGLWGFCSGRSIGRLHIQLCGRDGNQSIGIRLHYIRLSISRLIGTTIDGTKKMHLVVLDSQGPASSSFEDQSARWTASDRGSKRVLLTTS